MDKKQIEMDEQEISLVDILKMIWKYRWFILVFTLVITLIGFCVFYYMDFMKKDTASDQYSITINMPQISYEFYQNFKLNINYDFNNKFLTNNFGVNSIRIYSKEIKSEPYKVADFPVNSLQIDIFFNKNQDGKALDNLNSYLKDIIFRSNVMETVSLLKPPSSIYSSQSQFSQENPAMLYLFFTELYKNIDYIFSLNNRNIQKNYELINDYINNLKLDNSYLIYAKKIFQNILEKQFLAINTMQFVTLQIATEKTSYKSFIKKIIIIFIASIFLSIFLIFIIDFFKNNWKEIVKP
ncbi:MAG TPA: hypothetical protein PLU62_11760 [Ignavibacteriales bacterium]|nr:hypothetical protein [Ignavibacteriales bacterium]